jgi:hypothetical protein
MDFKEAGWEGVKLYLSGAGWGQVAGFCKHDNELSNSS